MSGTITFDDEFDTLSLHRTWQQGDKWQLIAPDSTDGRGGPIWGEGGTQWWVNPFNPNTPINGIYSVSNGMLNLSLLPTPPQYQSYIDQQAGAHMPDVGALLNNSPTTYQHFGYWEMSASVDRVPGFSFEIAIENVQLTGHWPPQLSIGVSTDGSGTQTLQAHMYNGTTSSNYSQPIDGTQQHVYGIDWEADLITFYFDNAKIFQVPNPGGVYQTDKMFSYLFTGGNYSTGTGVNPPDSSLPANAHIDYFRVYDATPQVVNASLSIAASNANRSEGNSGSTPFTFTVTRSGSTTGTSSVAWAVTGSGGSPANAADFTGGALPSGTLNFAAGQTSQTVTVNVAGDTTVEADEGFTVTLSNASAGTTISTATAAGSILNDDALASQLSIAAANANRSEGNSGSTPFTFTVTRSGSTTGTSSVAWAVTGSSGNPANATDFPGGALPSGTLSFAAGQTSKTITVNVAGDRIVEPNEGFTVTLSNASAGTGISTATASGTIRNDDFGFSGQQAASPSPNVTAGAVDGGASPNDNTANATLASAATPSGMQFVPLVGGAGPDTLSATGPGQILTGGAGADTLVGYAGFGDIFGDTAAGLDGDTIINFGGSDVIDVTDLLPDATKPLTYVEHGSDGTLRVTDGIHGASINFAGNHSAGNFTVLGTDGHDGTLIGYTAI